MENAHDDAAHGCLCGRPWALDRLHADVALVLVWAPMLCRAPTVTHVALMCSFQLILMSGAGRLLDCELSILRRTLKLVKAAMLAASVDG